MKRILILAVIVVATAFSVSAQDLTADWQGTLKTGGGELRLVLHITKAPDGTLKATLDSVDQGANGIPVSAITLKGYQLNLSVDAVHGTYDGKLSSDGKTIAGTWSQGQALPLDFKRSSAPLKTEHKLAEPSDIDGTWMGTLDTGTIQLRVVFHIVNTEDGLTATMDSPDQGMKGMPTTSVTRNDASLKIEAQQIGGVFEGKIAADQSSIEGRWTQRGTLPLVLKRVKNQSELERKRPQNPFKPYPYREEEVAYDNALQNVRLAATLTIPAGQGPFPCALLITGSGPQDRDESLLGHKPFLVLSDYLTRKGIAVLRADDRGVGKSTGVFSGATTADFATDAEAGVTFLKTRSEINPRKIGLVGHSEGGVIAAMVAARNSDIAFIVMMAGPGVPGSQILVAQTEAIGEVSGKSHDEVAKDTAKEQEIVTLVEAEKDETKLESQLKEKMAGYVPAAQIGIQIREITSPWFRYFISYDPVTALRKVTCPVLAINGEKDTQVPPKQNLSAIRTALKAAGNRHFQADEMPGLNHLFQTAKSGAPAEYAQIEETMSPVALEKVADWILAQ
jgi:pimeloyl-ACP methyl ester carboxylesterase